MPLRSRPLHLVTALLGLVIIGLALPGQRGDVPDPHLGTTTTVTPAETGSSQVPEVTGTRPPATTTPPAPIPVAPHDAPAREGGAQGAGPPTPPTPCGSRRWPATVALLLLGDALILAGAALRTAGRRRTRARAT